MINHIHITFNDNGSHRNRDRIKWVLQKHGATGTPHGNASLGSRNKSWSGTCPANALNSLTIELKRLNCTKINTEHGKEENTIKEKSSPEKGNIKKASFKITSEEEE